MLGDGVTEHLDTQVGVDAPLAGLGEDGPLGERQAEQCASR